MTTPTLEKLKVKLFTDGADTSSKIGFGSVLERARVDEELPFVHAGRARADCPQY